MQKTFLTLILFLSLSACQKSDRPPHPCALGNGNCSHNNGDIVGGWILEASRGYAAPNNINPDWVPADCSNLVTIEFTSDSTFKYNDNFPLKDRKFDRFRRIDADNFEIYCSDTSGNFYSRFITAKLYNSKEIVLHDMGIDRSSDELYDCY